MIGKLAAPAGFSCEMEHVLVAEGVAEDSFAGRPDAPICQM